MRDGDVVAIAEGTVVDADAGIAETDDGRVGESGSSDGNAESQRRKARQAAVVVLGRDGAVRALVGGRDYQQSQFNRAVAALRQPGSSFKLFTFLTALERGLTPGTTVLDAPIRVGGWAPDNYEHRYMGEVTLAGYQQRNLRVWVDNNKLKPLQLTMLDVKTALENEQVEEAAGYLENSQTEPDIKVMNDFKVVSKGRDQQLEAAIAALMRIIQQTKPVP